MPMREQLQATMPACVTPTSKRCFLHSHCDQKCPSIPGDLQDFCVKGLIVNLTGKVRESRRENVQRAQGSNSIAC